MKHPQQEDLTSVIIISVILIVIISRRVLFKYTATYQPFMSGERLIILWIKIKANSRVETQKNESDSLNIIRNYAIIVLDKTVREMENSGEKRKSQAGKSR